MEKYGGGFRLNMNEKAERERFVEDTRKCQFSHSMIV